MVLWARSKDFSGGCCKHDAIKKNCCEDERSERCCGDNNETKQNSCCVIKETKESADKVNVENSSYNDTTDEKVISAETITPKEVKSQDKIDETKSEEKGSNCACCHE